MPMSYESNLKTVLQLTLPKYNTNNMVILEPNERLKVLSNYSNAVEIDPNVPPLRYVLNNKTLKRYYTGCYFILFIGTIDQAWKWYEWLMYIWKKGV